YSAARAREPTQDPDPTAVLELVGDRGELVPERAQREVSLRDVGPGQTAGFHGGQGGVELGHGGGRDRTDPVGRSGEIAPLPGGGAPERLGGNGAHGGPLISRGGRVPQPPAPCAGRPARSRRPTRGWRRSRGRTRACSRRYDRAARP